MSFAPQREKIREKFVAALKEEFAGKGLQFTKGERVESSKPLNRKTKTDCRYCYYNVVIKHKVTWSKMI